MQLPFLSRTQPHDVFIPFGHVIELVRSNTASHLVASWSMPQYASDEAPEKLTVFNGT